MEISTSYKATQISNDRVVSSIAIIQNQQIYDVFPVPVFGCIVGEEGFILGAWENDIDRIIRIVGFKCWNLSNLSLGEFTHLCFDPLKTFNISIHVQYCLYMHVRKLEQNTESIDHQSV